MASNINGAIPVAGTPLDAVPIQTNFATANNEISALQNAWAAGINTVNGVTITNTPAAIGYILASTGVTSAQWGPPSAVGSGITQLTGDVTTLAGATGTVTAHVVGVNGISVPSGTQVTGNVLTIQSGGTSAAWVAPAGGAVNLLGDVSGPASATVVGRINGIAVPGGTQTAGNVLTIQTGGASAAWVAPATGGQVTLAGQVTGPSNATVVSAINGVTVPAPTGPFPQVFQATSATTGSWAAPSTGGGPQSPIQAVQPAVATMEMQTAGGTAGAPALPTNNMQIAFFRQQGWVGAGQPGSDLNEAYGGGLEIQTQTTQAWTTSGLGVTVMFFTTANNSTLKTVKFSIGPLGGLLVGTPLGGTNGDMGPGTINVAGGLYVNGTLV